MNAPSTPGIADATVAALREAHRRRKAEAAQLEALKAENEMFRQLIDRWCAIGNGARDTIHGMVCRQTTGCISACRRLTRVLGTEP